MIYSGIYLHKTNMVITTIDSNGELVAQRKLGCRKSQVVAYFHEFGQPHKAVVESTGSWYWLSDVLAGMGIELIRPCLTAQGDQLREVMRSRLRLVVRRTAARVQVHSLAEKAGWIIFVY